MGLEGFLYLLSMVCVRKITKAVTYCPSFLGNVLPIFFNTVSALEH